MAKQKAPARTKDEGVARVQQARDLSDQLTGIGRDDLAEMTIQETSGVVRRAPIYSTETGEMVMVPRKRWTDVLSIRNLDGKFRFVADPADAPEWKENDVKCVFHPESPERAMLDEICLASIVCDSEHLGSRYSQRIHGQNRHSTAWKVRADHLQDVKDATQAARMEEQTQAIRELGAAAVTKA